MHMATKEFIDVLYQKLFFPQKQKKQKFNWNS